MGEPPSGMTTESTRARPVGDVVEHREMGEQSVALGDDAESARLDGPMRAGGRVIPNLIAEGDSPRPDRIEAGDASEQRRLAGAVWTDHDEALPVGDLEVDLEVVHPEVSSDGDGKGHGRPPVIAGVHRRRSATSTPRQTATWITASMSARSGSF